MSRHLIVTGLLAFSLVACAKPVDPRTLTSATIPSYAADKPDKIDLSETAFIRGHYIKSTGFLGKPSSLTYLVSIDGQYYDVEYENKFNPVPAGQHMLTIGAHIGMRSAQVPAYANFKPGGCYVIRWEYGKASLNSFNSNIPPDTLWIEDEKTGEIVTPKLSAIIYDSDNRYIPPSGTTSTISGSTNGKLLDRIKVFTQMVDGKIVNGDGAATILAGEDPRPDYAVPLTAGRHGLGIKIEYNLVYGSIPVMFDVKPNTSYVVKFEEPQSKLYRNHLVQVIPYWIEEAATGILAFPKTDMPFFHGKTYTPEQLGQTAPPPATSN